MQAMALRPVETSASAPGIYFQGYRGQKCDWTASKPMHQSGYHAGGYENISSLRETCTMKVLAPLTRIFLTQPVFSKTKPSISGMSPTASVSPLMPSRQNAVRELFLLTVRRPTAPASAILSSSPASLPCQMKKLAPGDPMSPILKATMK